MHKLFIVLGALLAALAVIMGAFGTHALKPQLDAGAMKVFQTAVDYHLYHALGLILVGILYRSLPASSTLGWAGGLMASGIVIFSGSLYLLATTGIKWLGAITPLGGAAFIVAWVLAAVGVWRAQ
jgi:uncharacterized membrane protein YgdD (TMEM256/DUF423 family)